MKVGEGSDFVYLSIQIDRYCNWDCTFEELFMYFVTNSVYYIIFSLIMKYISKYVYFRSGLKSNNIPKFLCLEIVN